MTNNSNSLESNFKQSLSSSSTASLSGEFLLNALMVAMPDKIYFKDQQSRFIRINRTLATLFQIEDPDEACGKSDFDFFSSEHAMKAFSDEQRIMTTGVPLIAVEEKETWPNGRITCASTTKIPLRDSEGTIVGIMGMSRDITEHKLAEEALRKAELQMVESEKMALLGQLIAGVAHEINTPLGAIGAAVGNISSTLDGILPRLPAFFRSLPEEFQDNFLKLIQESISPPSPLSAKEERTYRNALKAELAAKEVPGSDRIAETFVMMGICGAIDPYLDMLRHPQGAICLEMAYKLSGLGRSATIITTAADRAGKIVFSLKNYAHFDRTGEGSMTNVAEGIETVLTLYHNQLKRGVVVTREYEEVPDIFCRPDELNQVWTNLIHNAIHAMDHKGNMTIAVSPHGEGVKVSVADSGNGVPPELREKIFEPFVTTKPAGEGSGLGLHIVRQIVESHGGTIHLGESAAGGAVFEVILPGLQSALP